MALIKKIVLDNGIEVKYHRILSLNKITNQSNIIEIASYTSEAKREEEKEATKQNEVMNVYISTEYVSTQYNEETTIKDCYGYLKSMDKFKEAKDI